MKTNLSQYNKNGYQPGRNSIIVALWYLCKLLIFNNPFLPFSVIKVVILRIFGASIGQRCVIKPLVRVKYPWRLSLGENVWIGESVWIDNLADVKIGNNCCISQGAMLLTGNHDYSTKTFDLKIGNISLEEGAWIGAKAIVCPSVKVASHAVLTAGSVATNDLEAYTIYQGNPAKAKKRRAINT